MTHAQLVRNIGHGELPYWFAFDALEAETKVSRAKKAAQDAITEERVRKFYDGK